MLTKCFGGTIICLQGKQKHESKGDKKMWISKRRIENIEKKLSALEKEMQRQRVEIRALNYPCESLKQAFEEVSRQNSHE